MADHIVYTDRWCERRKSPSNRFLYTVLGILVLFLAGEFAFQFLLAPNLKIDKITIENDSFLERDAVLKAAGIGETTYYFSLNPEAVMRNLEAWPMVKKAYVEKTFPNSLRILIQTRKPLAVALAEVDNLTLPLFFDEEGVVFDAKAGFADGLLPIVSGLRFEGVHDGMKLPAMLGSFLRDLYDLRNAHPAVFGCFSEYRIVKKGEGGFEVLLYPVNQQVPVRIEPNLNLERVKLILMVLDVMDRESLLDKVEEIDFRTGDIVYRMREE